MSLTFSKYEPPPIPDSGKGNLRCIWRLACVRDGPFPVHQCMAWLNHHPNLWAGAFLNCAECSHLLPEVLSGKRCQANTNSSILSPLMLLCWKFLLYFSFLEFLCSPYHVYFKKKNKNPPLPTITTHPKLLQGINLLKGEAPFSAVSLTSLFLGAVTSLLIFLYAQVYFPPWLNKPLIYGEI